MVRNCMRDDTEFGVVPIDSGNETTPSSSFFLTGVLAKIIDWNHSPDGLLQITSLGAKKFTVLNHRIEKNGLITGEIVIKCEKNDVPIVSENVSRALERKFRQILPLLSEIGEENPISIEAVYKLVDLLKLPYSTRVKILMSENLDEMLELVHNFVLPKGP